MLPLLPLFRDYFVCAVGNLSSHLEDKHYYDMYVPLMEGNSHSTLQVDADTNEHYRYYDFFTAFPIHIKLVEWIAADWQPYQITKTVAFRGFSFQLDKRYVPCVHRIYLRILHIFDKFVMLAIGKHLLKISKETTFTKFPVPY
jgi:hypothetical protein